MTGPEAYCEWGGGYCDDCAYDGAMNCIRDCTGVCDVDPVTDPVGYCTWFNGISTYDCIQDCRDEEAAMLPATTYVCAECDDNSNAYCEWDNAGEGSCDEADRHPKSYTAEINGY